jgi:transketolase
MEPMAEKWRAFGFDVREIDGHDFDQMARALGQASAAGRPRCVIAQTHKGRGVSFMEDRLEWHYLPMSDEHYREAIECLDAAEREIEVDTP